MPNRKSTRVKRRRDYAAEYARRQARASGATARERAGSRPPSKAVIVVPFLFIEGSDGPQALHAVQNIPFPR